MRFTYLKLVNFKRFPLRELEVFEHNFTAKLLMIAGPNGSGKSSLFNELTPLPSEKSNFTKNGYKEIHIEKDGVRYQLISDFRQGATYSFLRSGEELNKPGLVTAQKELVEQHFKITPTIHELLVGIESFTDMTLPARKKLFSAITHLNIDKVLEGYNHLKDELKTNKLLLKTQTTAYQVEEEKLQDENRLKDLKDDLENLKVRTDRLLAIRSEIQRYAPHSASEAVMVQVANRAAAIKKVLQSNYVLLTAYPNKDLQRYHTQKTTELSLVTYRLNQIYKQLEDKQKELRSIEVLGVDNQQQLQEEKTRLETFIEKSIEGLRIFKNPEEVTGQTEMAVYKLESNLPDVIQYLQPNVGIEGERQYTVEKYNRLVEEKRVQVERLQHLSAKELAIKQNISQTALMEGNLSCPACDHTWPISEALQASTYTQEELDRLTVEQTDTRRRMASVERRIEEFTDYFTRYKQLMALRKDTEISLAPFWNVVHERELIFTDPPAIASILTALTVELSIIGEIRKARVELDTIYRKLEQLRNTADLNAEAVVLQIQELDQEARLTQREKDTLLQQLNDIKRAGDLYTKLATTTSLLTEAKQETLDHNVGHLIDSMKQIIDDELRTLKLNAITIENELHQAKTVQYALDNYKKTIADTNENIKVLNLALEELCPKTGLIAKSVSSFLNVIIGGVNGTLERIWDYKMILKPIDVDNDALNYRFKVEVEDKLEVSDVSGVSSGMKEIINLAFNMVLYRLLGLEGYPIFLDEFGGRLDQSHKQKLTNLIVTLSKSDYYSQIFIITHTENYSFFSEAETIDLAD